MTEKVISGYAKVVTDFTTANLLFNYIYEGDEFVPCGERSIGVLFSVLLNRVLLIFFKSLILDSSTFVYVISSEAFSAPATCVSFLPTKKSDFLFFTHSCSCELF